MTLRGPKRLCGETNQISRTDQPPPLIADQEKPYSCSCPPFECVCNYQPMVPQQYLQHSPTNFQQHSYETYWTPEPTVPNTYQETQQPQYDFANFPNDLFQPEEIFQLDQPLRPDYGVQQNDAARSPPTLLDLGSGTIHREFKNGEFKNEEYWINQQNQQPLIINDDSNTSSCSRIYLNQSPESKDFNLNNNINELDRLQFNLDPKITDQNNYKYLKNDDYYNNQCVQIETDYNRSQNFTDLVSDGRIFYSNSQEDAQQNFSDNYTNAEFKNTHRYPDVRVQEKNELVDLDLPNYVDYSSYPYENKLMINDSIEIIHDFDYKLHCNANNSHYATESFENILTNN